ncbi:MAG: leucine-rich repeat domain-containing protein [Candidatus Kariarchaeaceae archaeon]|jgi:Leucine-rich repeat (LRR) protein
MPSISGTNNSYVDEIIGFSTIIIIFFLFRSIIFQTSQLWLLGIFIIVGMIVGGVLSAVVATLLGLEVFDEEFQTGIVEIDLSRRSIITIDLDAIQELQNLEILNLEDNLIEKIDFAPFRKHPALVNLDVSNNKIEVVDLTVLKTMKKLQRLDLRNNPIDALEAADLLQLKDFTTLYVDPQTQLTVEGVSLTNDQFHEMIEKGMKDVDTFLAQSNE